MKKRILGWILVACLIAAIPAAWAAVIKDTMTFEKALTILANITQTGNNTITGNLTVTGTNSFTGDTTVTGSITVTDEIVQEVYTHDSSAGNLTWSTAYGNILLTSGTTPFTVTLPAITAAMDGYVFIIKNLSGATTRTLSPNAADYIESTRGTRTGTSDATTDAAGDAKAFVANSISGTTNVWEQLWVNQT